MGGGGQTQGQVVRAAAEATAAMGWMPPSAMCGDAAGGIRRLTVSVGVDSKCDCQGCRGDPRGAGARLRRWMQFADVLQGGLPSFDVSHGDDGSGEPAVQSSELDASTSGSTLLDDPRFLEVVRISASVLVIIVLIVSVVRPDAQPAALSRLTSRKAARST